MTPSTPKNVSGKCPKVVSEQNVSGKCPEIVSEQHLQLEVSINLTFFDFGTFGFSFLIRF